MSPVYSKPFFELQLVFAQKMADLLQQPLEQALLRYTAFYRILGLDWSMDPTNPIWQAYIQRLERTAEKVDFTHQFYLQRHSIIPKFTDEEHWGCFAYDYKPEKRAVHFHFSDQDTSIYSPLSHHRIDVRKSELREMFQQVKQRHPDAEFVWGGSWLYNWESYRRLFPQAYVASAKKDDMPIFVARRTWKEFMLRRCNVHQESMGWLLQRVSQIGRV